MRALQQLRDRFFRPEHELPGTSPGSPLHDHRALRRRLSRARHGVAETAEDVKRGRRARGARRARLRELVDLEAALLQHFQDEEAGGPIADVLRVAPRYFDRADSLQKEHAALARELASVRELGEICGRSAERWAELDSRLGAFERRLQAHERAENEISSQVHLEDIGTAD